MKKIIEFPDIELKEGDDYLKITIKKNVISFEAWIDNAGNWFEMDKEEFLKKCK